MSQSRTSEKSLGSPTGTQQVTTDVQSVFCGSLTTFFLKNDGTVWGVGYNNAGELGDGTTINKAAPVQVWPLASPSQAPRNPRKSLLLFRNLKHVLIHSGAGIQIFEPTIAADDKDTKQGANSSELFIFLWGS